MKKYSDSEIEKLLEEWEYQSWCELCDKYDKYDNDEYYEEVMNTQNILKKEGF